MGSLRRQLITALAGSFALNLGQKVLMLAVTVLLARFMGPHDYGVYASAYAALVLVSVPASLGLPSLLVRELAASRLREQWGLIRGLLIRSFQIGLLVCLGIAVALLLIQPQLVHAGFPGALLWTTFAILPLLLLGAMRNCALRGLHHVVLGMVPETFIVPLGFLVGIVALQIVLPAPPSPLQAMGLRLSAVALAFIFGAVWLWRRLPPQVFMAKSSYQTARWLRAAAPMMWVGAMAQVTTQTDVLMLSAFKGASAAGVYQVAARGAELVGFVAAVTTTVLQPTLARLYAAGEFGRLHRVVRAAARAMLLAALAVTACYVFLGRDVLRGLFGAAFVPAEPALLILSFGWVLVAALGPARDTLLMIGRERQSAISISAAAGLNVLLNLVLVPLFGVAGAAVATATSVIAANAAYAWCVQRALGFRPSAV